MIVFALVFYGLGMFLWGYRSGISKAADDLRKIEKQTKDSKTGTEEEKAYE